MAFPHRRLAIPILSISIAWAFVTTRPALALLLTEEHFITSAAPSGAEYAVGTLAGQNPTTPGFSGAWFTSNGASPTVLASALTYSDANFPASASGSMLSPAGNSRIHRSLAPATNPFQSTDSGIVYLSFLLQTATNSGYRAFEMHNGGNDDAANRTLQIGLSSFTDFPSTSQFGFRVNNNSAFDFSLGAEDAAVHLFLVKFNLTTTNNGDSIRVWNNPSISSLASDPAGGVLATGFNFAADRLGAGHFTGTPYAFDELRIGTSLADVLTNTLACDINGNGICNSSDIAIISQNMYLPGAYEDGDIDDSGFIDFIDYRLFKDHPARVVGFDPPEGSGASVPEPASLLLILLAIAIACGSRVRHQRNVMLRTCFEIAGAASEPSPFGRGQGEGALVNGDSPSPQPSPKGRGRISKHVLSVIAAAALLSGASRANAAEQDLLNDTINFSGKTLNLRPWTQLPGGFTNIIATTTRPDDARMYVTAQEGTIFAIRENADGSTTPLPWFNAASALQTATGRSMNGTDGQRGLQSVAFHPDFGDSAAPGYGKLYTTMLENRPANPNLPAHFYLGNSTYGNGGGDGVLAEWTFNHNTGQVDANSYRELFRVNMPNFDHPIKQAKFNPNSRPGDEDYGLLYMTQGDSNNQDSLHDDPQDRGDVLGKMIRINPLSPSAGVRYSVPSTNPFYSSSNPSPSETPVLGEVYAYGFRNPHTFSFNKDDAGNTQILVGDIGRSNMEEVNLIVPGGNFGWTKREGTFVHLQGSTYPPNPSPNAGYIYGVTPLAANEATVGVGPDGNRFIYPVAQYDHNGPSVTLGQDFTASAVASGFVIRNGSDPDLNNQFVFFNFAFNHGDVYHTDFDEMLGAVTQLDPNVVSRDHPSELTQAELQRLHLTLDHDNNPLTAPQTSDSLNDLLGVFRNDSRVGEGVSGEMYITNKNNRIIYLVTNTVPDDRLTLTVDRSTGQMTVSNSTGSDVAVDRVSLFSQSGSLVPGEFDTLGGGWSVTGANNTKALNQTNAAASLNVTGATMASLGDAYEGQLVAFGEPVGEDVQFVYWTDGPTSRSFAGDVVYTGESAIRNTIVLTVDVATGEAVMLNQTPFAQEVEFYTISSPAGSLNPAGWDSLEEQGVEGGDWLASPPLATRLTEFQEDGTTTFDNSTPHAIGPIFDTGSDQDLVFEFLLAGAQTLSQGLVEFMLPGDYNDDGSVDAADYVVWRRHLDSSVRLPNDPTSGSVSINDYNVWKSHFGAIWPGSGTGSENGRDSVPEPSTALLAAIVLLGRVSPRRPLSWNRDI